MLIVIRWKLEVAVHDGGVLMNENAAVGAASWVGV